MPKEQSIRFRSSRQGKISHLEPQKDSATLHLPSSVEDPTGTCHLYLSSGCSNRCVNPLLWFMMGLLHVWPPLFSGTPHGRITKTAQHRHVVETLPQIFVRCRLSLGLQILVPLATIKVADQIGLRAIEASCVKIPSWTSRVSECMFTLGIYIYMIQC